MAVMFGFSVYDSISRAQTSGEIPVPREDDRLLGGHAVVMCGYDDKKWRVLFDPQFLGNRLGGRRIRLVAIRIRSAVLVPGFLDHAQCRMGEYRTIQSMINTN